VARAAGNQVIQAIRLPTSGLFYPSFQTVMSRLNADDRLLKTHEKIIEAIKWSDADEAMAWIIKHMNDLRKGYGLARLDMFASVALPNKTDIPDYRRLVSAAASVGNSQVLVTGGGSGALLCWPS
jgi:GntR family transcriptional repressor for pyruvate dehydrogenase complex